MDTIELLEDTGHWFDNGIKRITGENLYMTIGGELDENGYRPVANMGTIIKVPFGIVDIVAPATIRIPNEWSIIAHSGTRITIDPLDQTAFKDRVVENSKEVYLATANQLSSGEYGAYWLNFDNTPRVNAIIMKTTLERHKENDTGYYPAITTSSLNLGGPLAYHAPLLYGTEFTMATRHEETVQSSSFIERCFYNVTNENGVYYIDCVLFNDEASEKIVVSPLIYGYVKKVNDDLNEVYNDIYINYAPGKLVSLGDIPYEYLLNSNYFDPEQDASEPLPPPEAPGFSGDTSIPGGGNGNYLNYPSDDIGLPQLPTVSAIDTGFLTMYNPSGSQLHELVNYLWTSDWIDTIKKMVSNPMDAIISLQLAPYDIGNVVGSTCKIGAVTTDISMNRVTGQYAILNAGSVTIPEHWGNALDYNNVNISIFIPFVGVRLLDTNLCMNSTLTLSYYIDKLTGTGIAMLMVRKNNTSNSIYYTFDCNVNYQIPITGANYAETIKAIMSLTASSVGLGASIATGNMGGAMTAGASMIGSAFMAGSGACHYEGSGNLSANTGILGQFIPYVIVELPKQSLPRNFSHLKGYTSNITATLGSLSGFTVVESVHVDNIPGATDTEKQAIESLLKEGVIL